MNRHPAAASLLLLLAAGLAGCAGAAQGTQTSARRQMQRTGAALLAGEGRPPLPVLRADSPEEAYVLYAVLNHPAVAAAYYDWRAGVEDVVQARSLPDPQFVFQADITRTLSSLMPGFVFAFPGSGKRQAMGEEALAKASVSRRAYVEAVTSAAAETRKAWIDLAYLGEAIRLKAESEEIIARQLAIAAAGYETGADMGSLSNQIRLKNDLAQAASQRSDLEHRRLEARSRLKYALGIGLSEPDPAWPDAALARTPVPAEDALWARIMTSNPGLARMRSMVEMAEAGVESARRAGKPDFSLGAMADVRSNPTLFRPLATLDLPVWREKISALVAAAQARRDASAARYSAGELEMAAELARMIHMVHESDRMIAFIDHDGLPNLDLALAAAEASAESGPSGATMIPETEAMANAMRAERASALRDRETAVTDLMLLTAEAAPAGAPLPQEPAKS